MVKYIQTHFNGNGFQVSYKEIGTPNWETNFENYLNTLTNNNWKVYKITEYIEYSGYSFFWNTYVLRKPLDE